MAFTRIQITFITCLIHFLLHILISPSPHSVNQLCVPVFPIKNNNKRIFSASIRNNNIYRGIKNDTSVFVQIWINSNDSRMIPFRNRQFVDNKIMIYVCQFILTKFKIVFQINVQPNKFWRRNLSRSLKKCFTMFVLLAELSPNTQENKNCTQHK